MSQICSSEYDLVNNTTVCQLCVQHENLSRSNKNTSVFLCSFLLGKLEYMETYFVFKKELRMASIKRLHLNNLNYFGDVHKKIKLITSICTNTNISSTNHLKFFSYLSFFFFCSLLFFSKHCYSK